MSALASKLHGAGARSLLVLGRGYSYATCLEGALKIKELTYLHRYRLRSCDCITSNFTKDRLKL